MAQRTVLRDLGYDEMQGYLFARPMTGDALEALLTLFYGKAGKNQVRNAFAA